MRHYNSKRDQIILEAQRLFVSDGYKGTSIRELARKCGCSQGNIYSHFASKEELLYHILLEQHKFMISSIKPLCDDRKSDPVDRFRSLIFKHINVVYSLGAENVVNFDRVGHNLSPEHYKIIRNIRNSYNQILNLIIQDGIESGAFYPCNVDVLSFAITAVVLRIPRWYKPRGALSLAEFSDVIFRLFYQGIKCGRSSDTSINGDLGTLIVDESLSNPR